MVTSWTIASWTIIDAMAGYVALLRGINVGGSNPIRMADLRACFEQHGFERVATYIQSGNVVFDAPPTPAAELAGTLERMISAAFPYRASVVVRSRDQMRAVVRGAPEGFGSDPDIYRYDVIFLKPPLTARSAMASVSTRPGVDAAHPGRGVLYFSRLAARAGQSRLSSIVGSPIYPSITIRNWNTTTRLGCMLDELPTARRREAGSLSPDE
jgi:uncharacterized protein (DUF1697 family)